MADLTLPKRGEYIIQNTTHRNEMDNNRREHKRGKRHNKRVYYICLESKEEKREKE